MNKEDILAKSRQENKAREKKTSDFIVLICWIFVAVVTAIASVAGVYTV